MALPFSTQKRLATPFSATLTPNSPTTANGGTGGGSTILIGTGSVTLEGWMRVPKIATGGAVFAIHDASAVPLIMVIATGTNSASTPGKLSFLHRRSVGVYDVSAEYVQPHEWVHVVVILETAGTRRRIFIDGVKVDDSAVVYNLTTGGSAYFGIMNGFTNGLPNVRAGRIRIWTRALTDQEVQDLYYLNRNDGPMRVSLAAEYVFAEGAGTSVADTSGNARTMTLTGGCTWVQNDYTRSLATPNTRNLSGPITWSADFTGYPTGALVTLPSGLILTRSTIATVQTSTSTIVAGVAINSARIGRKLDADVPALVLEETRTNECQDARNMNGAGWSAGSTVVTTPDAATGPDGTAAIADRSQVTSGGYSRQFNKGGLTVASSYTASTWWRDESGVGKYQWDVAAGIGPPSIAIGGTAADAVWHRVVHTDVMGATGNEQVVPVDGRDLTAYGGIAAGARDNYTDLVQVELGKFATETIITSGVALARGDDRLRHPNAKIPLGSAGFGGMYFRLRPKGGVDDYETSVYLWRDDGSHFAFIKTGVGNDHKIYVGTQTGTSIISSGALTWAAGDVLDVWTEITESLIKTAWRVNGGAATLFTAVSYARPATPTGSCYVLPPQAFFGTVLFSSYVEKIHAYEPNYRPSWVA